MKAWLKIGLPILVIGTLLVGGYFYSKPQIEAWLLKQGLTLAESKLPLKIQASRFRFNLLLPEARLEEVAVQIPASATNPELDINADAMVVKLDLISLIAGRIHLSSVIFEGLGSEIDLTPYLESKQEPKLIEWGPFFKALKKIPVGRIAIQDADLKLYSEKNRLDLDLIDFDLLILNEKDRLTARLDLKDAETSWGELASPLRARLDATLSPQGLDIPEVRLLGFGSLIKGSASFKNIAALAIAPAGNIKYEIKASLPQMSTLLSKIKSMPTLKGSLEASGTFELEQGSLIHARTQVFGKDLELDAFKIGQIETEARLFNDVLEFPKISLTHPAGLVDITKAKLKLIRENNSWTSGEVHAQVETDLLDLHDLLESLNIGDLPLELLVGAKLNCTGPLFPAFRLECEGEAEGDELEVRSGPRLKDTIVQIDQFTANGSLTVDTEKVTYQTKIKLHDNEGYSKGTISYQNGFNIDYETPKLEMKNIQNLANFSYQGNARLKGATEGNAHTAHFFIKAEAENFWFENFYLGEPKLEINYKNGILGFSSIDGSVKASTYQGNLDIDLQKLELRGAFESNRLEMLDVAEVLSKRIPFPFEVSGVGSAKVQISGPLKINQLTYDATAEFPKLIAAGESLEKAKVEVQSRSGEFQINRAVFYKSSKEVRMTGVGHPSGEIQFLLEGQGLALERSENIAVLGSNISGLLDFTLTFTDQIRNPNLLLKASAKQIIADEQEIPDTEAEILITPRFLKGTTSLMGGKLYSKYQFPFHADEAFELQIKAQDWNPTSLFALIGSGPLLAEYQSSMTGTLNLKSLKGGFWQSTGQGSIEKFFIQRGELSLKNPAPMKMQVDSGQFSFDQFRLDGSGTFVELSGDKSTKEKLNLSLNAETDLRIVQIFLPFLEELSGRAKASMSIAGTLFKPQILGSAETKSAFVKIKGFPHPFEKIDASVLFSQSRVLIQSAQGEIGGGLLEMNGNIKIEGVRNLPTQIRAKITGTSLNVPDKVRTKGNADLQLLGSWFPFVISGTYVVSDGLIEKEFADDGSQGRVQRSSYLPKMILQKTFEPILLDLQVQIPSPLPVKNSIVSGSVTGSLHVRGVPTSPGLTGLVQSGTGSQVLIRDKVFDVATATAKFLDPKEINPELYVSARSRVNEYDISLLVQGTAKAPVIRMTSLPPLAEQDIVSLLALGVTTDKSDKRFQTKETQSDGAFQIGSALINQIPIVQKAQKATGFNVQLSSNYDDTKNVEVKRISISKQVTEKVKASASRLVGEAGSNEFKLEYNFSPSVSAIGVYEQREAVQRSNLSNTQAQEESILGLDLEFRREFH